MRIQDNSEKTPPCPLCGVPMVHSSTLNDEIPLYFQTYYCAPCKALAYVEEPENLPSAG